MALTAIMPSTLFHLLIFKVKEVFTIMEVMSIKIRPEFLVGEES